MPQPKHCPTAQDDNNNSEQCYDIVIVGCGLIGSAAARHAAKLVSECRNNEKKKIRIALIGPSEERVSKARKKEAWIGVGPSSSSSNDDDNSSSKNCVDSIVFGAHYDEGRITRKTDPDPVWAELAARSIDRYGEIGAATKGVENYDDDASLPPSFYVECGHLAVFPKDSPDISNRWKNIQMMLDASSGGDHNASIPDENDNNSDADSSCSSSSGNATATTASDSTAETFASPAQHQQLLSFEKLGSTTELRKRFPYLEFPEHSEGIFENKDAGYISARGLVSAQVSAAKKMGVDVYDRVVQEVLETGPTGNSKNVVDDENIEPPSPSSFRFVIRCHDDSNNNNNDHTNRQPEKISCFYSNKVLVATGAFTNTRKLLPHPLDLTPVKTETVHFQLPKVDADRLHAMPSIIYKDSRQWAYMLPPILYPDGTTRLKLGGARIVPDDSVAQPQTEDKHIGVGVPTSLSRTMESTSSKELVDWYINGDEDHHSFAIKEMTEMLCSFVPNMNMSAVRIQGNTCATLNTPTRRPYIGELSPGWAVATGGNGFAAKSSDELGRLAALCILDRGAFSKESICGKNVAETMKPIIATARSTA